jgi:hypothetical protein
MKTSGASDVKVARHIAFIFKAEGQAQFSARCWATFPALRVVPIAGRI